MNAGILLVDDEPTFRVLAEEVLASEGFEVRTASNLRRAREVWRSFSPDVVILDRRLPDGDGIDFLKEMRAEGAGAPIVVVVTAYGDVENAVEALRAGAWDYLAKPVQLADLVVKLRKVMETRGLRDRLTIARTHPSPLVAEPQSPSMRAALERLGSVAISPLTPVFLHGPSGAGKQFAAEALHRMTWGDTDADAPFVELNCAALPDDLVESELFGHEKGAFTDARTARRGLIEMASGGTLFLDEITELPIRSQAKLLKFIDSMRFRRLGGQREISVELRIVAATNQDIDESVRSGRFREDLYHRLAVFQVMIPPLSERPEDIPGLAAAFASFFAARIKKRVQGLSAGALRALSAYRYPGNVRELRNIVERAVILSRGAEITEADLVLPQEGASSSPPPGPGDAFFQVVRADADDPPALEAIEKAYVARVLEHFEGRRMQAAQALGISYPTFLRRLREMGIDSGSPS